MVHNELNLSFSEDPTIKSNICARCGKNAEIHLSLLEGAAHPGGSFCLPCGEAVIHDLRKQHAAHMHAEQPGGIADADIAHTPFLHNNIIHEDIEGGIIFWEGHGWSSDGPFAGA